MLNLEITKISNFQKKFNFIHIIYITNEGER